ncbi:Eco57I restriction-modification methylase domain-containing protein [Macrococcoides caseolyticum]|uniref:site-specific DNA-methyltransferase (adenine-specific) n=1 Tax=Macrococcoides canis TaxID=1855823 RepID=A0A6G5ZZ82_9STAP|nr:MULTISPECIES: TaqI-like C-terminal specificity domain-containing protein [Macrococcus]MBQ5152539.1 restriction endonuclease subunit M [Macrococcus caseolyticus]QHW12300.1 DNA methylase [Macrococcus canis]QIH77387.1 restriction endonuclease subunit M [Macrococcus canis]RAI80815.1 restriction endonuclease subunit M [Macrococcus caseolyticus subsp. hominis]RKO15509.1 restriction endonuclease subunit M [Macrococcus caseolyticus]
MANIFPINKVKEQASKIKTESIINSIKIIEKWHNHYHEGSLKTDKETTIEQSYNNDFFINILGYRTKPNNEWTFKPQPSTIIGQHPDAILSNSDDNNVYAVIELKGANIPLDRPQRRAGNLSPVQQAFKYKPLYRHCPFVLVSNFWEFRIYQDNQLDYEYWTLDDLIDPKDDYIKFKSWYYLLCEENFIGHNGKSNTENLISEVRIEQEKISKIFYQEYKDSRLELLRDMYKNNIKVRENIDLGISKAQKIIDRIVFICFAEDKGLIPDNKLHEVIEYAKNNPYSDIWGVLKGFFNAIDIGSEKLDIPNGYNGGLFKIDEILNDLKISDEALLKVANLSKYDFEQDLSVTILGHIFEQSISDLEEIKSKVNFQDNIISKRKQNGIYYTPDYIVRYLVENTLGTYLKEIEVSIQNNFRLKEDLHHKNYEKREKEAYRKYQEILRDIKIIDPSCGSGAFLVYVFDYLLAEHKRVGDILGGDLFSTESYIKDILRNNIYGVDLNEESVEITKLSLWLKTAQKGKKLTSLDKNIKCGNSLIDDASVDKNKNFNWKEEFKEVFENGGFDIVIGNPPYVPAEMISNKEKEFYKNNYKSAKGRINLYPIFYEKSLKILKNNGKLGFITPYTIVKNKYYMDSRRFIIENSRIIELIDFTGTRVFDAAAVDSMIVLLSKEVVKEYNYKFISQIKNFERNEYVVNMFSNLDILKNEDLSFTVSNDKKLIDKIYKNTVPLENIVSFKQGIITGGNSKFLISEKKMNTVKVITGSDFNRYNLNWKGQYLIYDIDQLHRPRTKEIFEEKEKLIMRQTGSYPICMIDYNQYYTLDTVHNGRLLDKNVNIKYILALINSKLIRYVYEATINEKGKTYAQVKIIYIAKLPIKLTDKNKELFIESLVNKMIKMNDEFNRLTDKFLNRLTSSFSITKVSKKLRTFYDFTFADLLKELKKNKVYLTLKEQDDLEDYFIEYKNRILNLNEDINFIDNKLDEEIFDIYDLDENEKLIINKYFE